MFLIYGGNGWIGKKIVSILEERKTPFMVSKIRADDIKAVESEINEIKPTNILCLLGRTHGTFEDEYIPTIDYLEKKGKVKENVRDNLFCPIALALLCKKYDIHLTYLGTGCIFTYDDDKRIFTEEDEPNFFGSSYSVVKGYTDRLMHMFDHVLNVRIRMPISSDTSPRNFIVKLLKYEKICSMQNSMTVLDELLPIMCDMISNRETGTVNLTNPGTIEHSEILDMYKEIVDPKFEYKLFSYEDQMKVIACDRSNNELSSSLLTSKYQVKNIKDSVRDILNTYRQKVHKNLEGYYYCQNSEFIFLCGKEFDIPSDKIITELFMTAKESYCEILSPVIVDKSNKILFYGGIICRNKVVMFDESTISFETLDSKNSFNYVRPSMIFYPRYFVIKKTVLNEMNIKNVSEINIVDCIDRNIRVTPFIRVTQNIYLEHVYKGLEKINIFNFEEACIKENIEYNIKHGSFPFRIQNRKFLDNSLKHALLIESEIIRPDNNCGALYTLNFIRLLMRNGYRVHYISANYNFDYRYILALQKMGVYVALDTNFGNIKDYLKIHSCVYDYIFESRLYDVRANYEIIRKYSPKSKVIYITHDLHSLRQKRFEKLANSASNSDMEKEEISYIERSDMALIVSEYEYEYLKQKKISNIMYFPICYEKAAYDRSSQTVGMYFIGSAHSPNIDAINFFLKYIYSEVLKIQKIRLYIFGDCCNTILPDLIEKHKDNITMKTYIDDRELSEFFKVVRLNLITVRYGAGVKGKLLQACNNGVPTITSSIGVEGTCFQHMKDVIVMNMDDPSYAFKLVQYYNNIDLLNDLSKSAKNTFDTSYSLDKGDNYMQNLIEKLDSVKPCVNKVCVIFNTYNKPEIIKLLKNHLESISNSYTYDFFLVNNGDNKLDDSYTEYNIVDGDNSVNEFSGIQKCIDMLVIKNEVDKYDSFIICNDTIALNYPLSAIYNMSETTIEIVCRNRYAKGHRDSFCETMTLDKFSFDSWYRSFLVFINKNLFKDMGYRFMNYTVEDVYDGETMKINISKELKSQVENWLSQERYRGVDMKKKYTCIFNEYRFSHEINNALKGYKNLVEHINPMINNILKQYTEFGLLKIINKTLYIMSSPICEIYNDRSISGMVNFIKKYISIHGDSKIDGMYFYTAFDGYREHTPPSLSGKYSPIKQEDLPKYGTCQFINSNQLSEDYPLFPLPVICYSRHKNDISAICIPNHDFIVQEGFTWLKSHIRSNDRPFDNKINKIHWRGGSHGVIYSIYDKESKYNQRMMAFNWGNLNKDISDIEFSKTFPNTESIKYKYLLDIDGMVNAWSALVWKLSSNSVVFKVESHWEEWYYKYLIPWEHYIPVKSDLSDLNEKYEWAENNQEKAKKIVENANILMDKLSFSYALDSKDFYNSFLDAKRLN